jgi:hypothetical protein
MIMMSIDLAGTEDSANSTSDDEEIIAANKLILEVLNFSAISDGWGSRHILLISD